MWRSTKINEVLVLWRRVAEGRRETRAKICGKWESQQFLVEWPQVPPRFNLNARCAEPEVNNSALMLTQQKNPGQPPTSLSATHTNRLFLLSPLFAPIINRHGFTSPWSLRKTWNFMYPAGARNQQESCFFMLSGPHPSSTYTLMPKPASEWALHPRAHF